METTKITIWIDAVKKELSDGSFAYGVQITDGKEFVKFDAIDRAHAHALRRELAGTIAEHTTETVEG